MAHKIARILLTKYPDRFEEMFISTVSLDFPKPDFVFLPLRIGEARRLTEAIKIYKKLLKEERKYPAAFEFKTPYVYKHEYIMGVGQAITYNTTFARSYLIVPEYNIEGFEVLAFIQKIVDKNNLSIGLISYKPESLEKVEIIKDAKLIEKSPEELAESTRGIRRSYAYWRETKPEEVYDFLKIIEEESKHKQHGDIRKDALTRLWDEILSLRFAGAKQKSAFLLNYGLFFAHLGLWDGEGRLTPLGRYTLIQGERFGRASSTFMDMVTYLLLRYGGHFFLLEKIYSEQEKMSEEELSTWESWARTIKDRLLKQNFYISTDDFRVDLPRLPYAYANYFSGIFFTKDFKEGKGFSINWTKILSILDKGKDIYSPIEVE